MQGQNLDAGKVFNNGFGERTFHNDVATVVHISEDRSVARKLSGIFVRALQRKADRFVLAYRSPGLDARSRSSLPLKCHTVYLLSSECGQMLKAAVCQITPAANNLLRAVIRRVSWVHQPIGKRLVNRHGFTFEDDMIDLAVRPVSGVFLWVAVMPLFCCGSCGLHGIKLTGSKGHRGLLLCNQLGTGAGGSRPHSR